MEHDINNGRGSSIVKVDSDTFAVAYQSDALDGTISTFDIPADGSTITEVGTFEHDTNMSPTTAYNSLVQVDSDTYALAYTGTGDDGYITTFEISADGTTITECAACQLEHDTANGVYNSLVQVDSDTYALAFLSGTDGTITTFTISADGTTVTEEASLIHDASAGSYNSLIQFDSDTYALAYTGAGDDGFISTFTISADGSTITEVQSLEHDTDTGQHNSLVQVDSDTYALAYLGEAGDGYITTFTISLDVAVTAISTNGGGSCGVDCIEPTLGVNSNGKRLVDNGFSYNGKSVDVDYYFTPYPLVTVNVGEQNVAEFKIYENRGPDNISHFELAFGLASGESIGMSRAVINWDKSFDGIETVTLDDPENVLENIKVTTSEGYCSDEMQTKCLIVKVEHTFRAPLDFNILGTNVWDTKSNGWQNYYNHGIEVIGESLNPPDEYDGISKGHIYHLTETGKGIAIDEFGDSWSFHHGTWNKDYIKPSEPIPDYVTSNGYCDRNCSWFEMNMAYQAKLAKETMSQICLSCGNELFELSERLS